jgi:hypothetical protein
MEIIYLPKAGEDCEEQNYNVLNNFHMKYRLELEIADNETSFAEKFFKNISFVKKVKAIAANEITNPAILQSIEDYEKGKVKPTPLNLAELKAMLNA